MNAYILAFSSCLGVAGGAIAIWGFDHYRAQARSGIIRFSVMGIGLLLAAIGSTLTFYYIERKADPVRIYSRNTASGILEALTLSARTRSPDSAKSDPEELKKLFGDAIASTTRSAGLPFASIDGTPASMDLSSVKVVSRSDGKIKLWATIYTGNRTEILGYEPKVSKEAITFSPSDFDTTTNWAASVPPIPPSCDRNRTRPCTFPVWYATTREVDKALGYGNRRIPSGSPMNYGVASVVIPQGHDRGSTGSSWFVNKWRTIAGGERDEKLQFIHNYKLGMDEFWLDLGKEVSSRPNPADRVVLLFIHGFNVSFQDAMIRAAQLGYDLDNPGATASFTWPTAESMTEAGWIADRASIEGAENALAHFIEDLATKANATQLHIIAHSLGNQGLLRALQRIDQDKSHAPLPIGQMVLVAPAVDRELFESLASLFPKLSVGTTLYVSSKDKAVGIGSWISHYQFAGYAPPHTILDKIDTVDVSSLQYDLLELGHSYVGAESVLNDINQVLSYSATPNKRGLSRHPENGHFYWTF